MFDKHLQSHGISYRSHQKLAFFFARESLRASFMAFFHGLFPSLFETSASDLHKSILPRYQKLLQDIENKVK